MCATALTSTARSASAEPQSVNDSTKSHVVAGNAETKNQDAVLSSDGASRVTPLKGKNVSRKMRGYWLKTSNVCTEMQSFCATHNFEDGVMPTQQELLKANRVDLLRALQRNGMREKVVLLLNLRTKRKPNGYWSRPDILQNELQSVRVELGLPEGVMPSSALLIQHGRSDLFNAVVHAGGFNRVAKSLRLRLTKRIYVEDDHVQAEYSQNSLENCAEADASITKEANQRSAKSSSTMKMQFGIQQKSPSVVRKKPGGWWNWRRFEKEIRAFATECCSGNMPTQAELVFKGRHDLINAMRKHGGVESVARRAALPMRTTKRPRGHWTDKAVLYAEILSYTTRNGHPGLMPRREELMQAGRADLCYAISKHGGFSALAAKLHLMWHGPSGYWRSFRNLRKRLTAWVKLRGAGEKMPSYQELYSCGRYDLIFGIALHGGFMNVAARMNFRIKFPRRDEGYWLRPENVQRALQDFVNIQPLEYRNIMPSSVHLVEAGRLDLANIIRDHGGWVYYAQRLGLRYVFDRRSQGFWQSEENVKNELLQYMTRRYGDWDIPGMGVVTPIHRRQTGPGDTSHTEGSQCEDAIFESYRGESNQESAQTENPTSGMSSSEDGSAAKAAGHEIGTSDAEKSSSIPRRKKRHTALSRRVRITRLATTIPSVEMLKRDGRSDIAFAIQRYQGGEVEFAKRHGFQIAPDYNSMRPHEELSEWHSFASEMRAWIRGHGCVGIMPSRTDLIRTGRNDLRYAIYSHGGSAQVARRLQLVAANSKTWLAKWLALQAGRLALRLTVPSGKWRASVPTGEEELPRTFRGDRLALRLMNLRQRRRQPLLKSIQRRRPNNSSLNVGKPRASSYKLSENEFRALRNRYKHIPADDIISP